MKIPFLRRKNETRKEKVKKGRNEKKNTQHN